MWDDSKTLNDELCKLHSFYNDTLFGKSADLK